MPPVLDQLKILPSSPHFWLHILFLAIFIIFSSRTSWLIPKALRHTFIFLAVLYFIMPLVHLIVVHPTVIAVFFMLVSALLLRLAGRWGRRPHPGPVFFIGNLLLGSGMLYIFFVNPFLWTPEILVQMFSIWSLFNLSSVTLTFILLDGQRSQNAKRLATTLLPPLWLILLFNAVLFILSTSGNNAGETADFSGTISRFLTVLNWFSLMMVWAHFTSDSAHQKERAYSELLWGRETLRTLLKDFSGQLAESVPSQDFLVHAAEKLMSFMGCAGAAIFLLDEYEDVLKPACFTGDFPPLVPIQDSGTHTRKEREAMFMGLDLPLDNSLLNPACRAGKVSYFESVATSYEFLNSHLSNDWEDLNLLTAPLVSRDRLLGVTAITFSRTGKMIHPKQMRRFKDISRWTGEFYYGLLGSLHTLERQKIDIEATQIKEIQELLLPQRLPRLASISLGAMSRAARGVSGDFYDVIPLRKGEILIVIGDVAGKGIPAGMAMVMIRTILHLFAHQKGMSPSKLLEIINWGISGKVSLDRFATLTLVHYQFLDGKTVYSNAAHHPMLVFRSKKGVIEELDSEGIPIGLEKKSKYKEIRTKLEKNDIIMLYTDGVTEAVAEDGQLYSLDRLKKLVIGNATQKAERIKEALKKDLDVFCGKSVRQDDQTLLVMKVDN